MNDAVEATLMLMDAEPGKIKERTAYNLTALSFSAKELAENVAKYIPEFKCTFTPDSRQKIADSWPKTIDDSRARADWGWQHKFSLDEISQEMIKNLKQKFSKK